MMHGPINIRLQFSFIQQLKPDITEDLGYNICALKIRAGHVCMFVCVCVCVCVEGTRTAKCK